jgi:hypothetical protein
MNRASDERPILTHRSERVIAEPEAFDVVIVGGGAAERLSERIAALL